MKDLNSLDEIFDFLATSLPHADVSDMFSVQLAVEEIFTNMVKYNNAGVSEITIRLEKSGNMLLIRVSDHNVEPFDVTTIKTPELDASLRERAVGGLGFHLAKKVMDKIDYDYVNHCSRVTLIKNLKL